jgi:hypothetical protein
VNNDGEITFDIKTFQKMGEPEAILLNYEEHSRTIGLTPAHPDDHSAALVRARHARSNRVVRLKAFFQENDIVIDRTLRFPYPFIEDKTLILDLRTAVTASRGGIKKVKKRPQSPRAIRASLSHLKHKLNDYGKDIWIESEDHLGRPAVWYSLDSNGRKQKHVRDGGGISISREEE